MMDQGVGIHAHGLGLSVQWQLQRKVISLQFDNPKVPKLSVFALRVRSCKCTVVIHRPRARVQLTDGGMLLIIREIRWRGPGDFVNGLSPKLPNSSVLSWS